MKIANIVAVAKMKEPFDLGILNSKIGHNDGIWSNTWLKTRLKPEDYYVAFYGSGKFLLTGINTFEDLNHVLKRVLGMLKSLEIPNEFDKLNIVNLVCTDELGFEVSLENILTSLNSSLASYEPELYHGLYYKDNDGVHFTLFSSGKIIMTGLKDRKIAESKIKEFKQLICAI